MRVLLVSTERAWQGGERQALLLAAGLGHRGHECVLLAREDGHMLGRARAAGLEAVALAGAGQSPRGWIGSRRLLRSFRAEVVHFNDPRAMTAAGPASLGLPDTVRIASRRVAFPMRSPWLYRRVCHRILCVSEAVRDQCARDGIPAALLRVVYDGVDAARVEGGDGDRARRSLGLPDGAPTVLSLASLVPCKGHADLLEAARGVVARHPQVRFLLAGEGESSADLRRAASDLGLGDHVLWLGLRDDIADLLAAADLLVLPSREEGLGSSVIEAMLAGTPVVATDAGGIPELLEGIDGPTGWVVPTGEPPALEGAIEAALADPAERSRRAEAARERARARFTVGAMVDATIAAYRETLRERPS